MVLRILSALSILCVLSGCSPNVAKEDRNPAPSSSYDKPTVLADAGLWAVLRPGRAISEIAPTGSMAPLMDSRSVALYEVYTGQTLYKGDWIVFDRGDVPNVLHRIDDVTSTHVHVAGVNNALPDGWFPFSKVKLRVAGVLYSSK
jgi:hypothetical protein